MDFDDDDWGGFASSRQPVNRPYDSDSNMTTVPVLPRAPEVHSAIRSIVDPIVRPLGYLTKRGGAAGGSLKETRREWISDDKKRCCHLGQAELVVGWARIHRLVIVYMTMRSSIGYWLSSALCAVRNRSPALRWDR
jgi:hypothetical protein